MTARNEKNNTDKVKMDLDLTKVGNRNIADLSGGELQRFAIAMVCIQEADVYVCTVLASRLTPSVTCSMSPQVI